MFCKYRFERLIQIILVLFTVSCFAQQSKIDSLLSLLKTAKEDTIKANLLVNIAEAYDNDFEPNPLLANEKRLEYYLKALEIREKIGDKKEIANACDRIGVIYKYQSNYEKSIKNLLVALKIREEIGDKHGMGKSYVNLGVTYGNQGNNEKALEYYYKALKIFRESANKKGEANSLVNIGIMYMDQGAFPKAQDNLLKGLKIIEETGDKIGLTYAYQNLGYLNNRQGHLYQEQGKQTQANLHYQNALEYGLKGLKIAEAIKYRWGVACASNVIGDAYRELGQLNLSLNYLTKSLSHSKGDKAGMKEVYSSLSKLYEKKDNYKLTYQYYKLYSALKDSLSNTDISTKIANIQNQYQAEKEEKIRKLEEEKKEAEHKAEVKQQKLITWSVIGGLLLVAVFSVFMFNRWRITQKQKKIIEVQKQEVADAFKNIETVSTIGQKITSTLNLEEVIGILHGHINSVMDASGLVIYIYNSSQKSLDIKYTIGKHGNIIANSIPIDSNDSFCVWSLKNKKEVFINDVSKEYSKYLPGYYWSSIPDSEIVQAFINIPLIVGENAIGVISVQSFNKNVYTREHLEILKSLASFMSAALNNADAYSLLTTAKENLTEQKKLIEEKNKDITDSINYAKRIQKAMLPHRKDIWSAFPQSFVLYKPKDIVSGDFYFFAPALKGEKANTPLTPFRAGVDCSFIAAADCTGHGVPGAFMSLIGSDKLEDAVSQSSDTSQILSFLNKGVKTALKQSGEDDKSTRDGMDIALCSVDTKNYIVRYAGANRPLWIIRKGATAVEEIKATKKAIGGFTEDDQHYETHEIKLNEGDTFYLSTDGYADTFGKNGKKMMTKTFKDVLLSIQDKPMKEQEKHLGEFVENWMGGTEQVDDILVIGIRG